MRTPSLRLSLSAFVCLSVLAWGWLVAIAPAHAVPLPPERAELFLGTREDKPAEALLGVTAQAEGKHFVTGNEWNLHLFHEALKDKGGGYVGVGSDQAYLFLGWQKPELAWLIDYDPYVIQIHKLYLAFFAAADSPEAFRALWDKERHAEAKAALRARWGDKQLEVLDIRLRSYRTRITKRLDELTRRLTEVGVSSFLTDAATYTWVKEFLAEGRARPMVADLLKNRGLRGIGKAARELGVPIRVVYLSNAEEYWDYSPDFRKNMESLFHDAQSLLVRTLLTWDRNQDYRYNVQFYSDYLAWLAKPWVVRVRQITGFRRDEGTEPDFFVVATDPDTEESRLRKAGQLDGPPNGVGP